MIQWCSAPEFGFTWRSRNPIILAVIISRVRGHTIEGIWRLKVADAITLFILTNEASAQTIRGQGQRKRNYIMIF